MRLQSVADLKQLEAKLRDLQDVKRRIAARVAQEFTNRAGASFDSSRTPTGAAWRARGTRVETGQLREQVTQFRAEGTTVTQRVTVPYARFHGEALASDARLPSEWVDATDRIVRSELEAHFQL